MIINLLNFSFFEIRYVCLECKRAGNLQQLISVTLQSACGKKEEKKGCHLFPRAFSSKAKAKHRCFIISRVCMLTLHLSSGASSLWKHNASCDSYLSDISKDFKVHLRPSPSHTHTHNKCARCICTSTLCSLVE